MKPQDKVIVLAAWSEFYGMIGRAHTVEEDRVMVYFAGDRRLLRFGRRELAVVQDSEAGSDAA